MSIKKINYYEHKKFSTILNKMRLELTQIMLRKMIYEKDNHLEQQAINNIKILKTTMEALLIQEEITNVPRFKKKNMEMMRKVYFRDIADRVELNQ